MSETRNEDQEITRLATRELTELPTQLRAIEQGLADIGADLRVAKTELSDAELSAQVNCNADGKNAEMRKMQLEKAVADDPHVAQLRGRLIGLEGQHATAEVDFNDLHRRFRAAMVLAELQTAKINYRSRFETKQRGDRS